MSVMVSNSLLDATELYSKQTGEYETNSWRVIVLHPDVRVMKWGLADSVPSKSLLGYLEAIRLGYLFQGVACGPNISSTAICLLEF